jgi:hypothetical protein
MTRVYDHDRPAQRPPLELAQVRAERLADPLDREKFLLAFQRARVAEARGDTRLYHWYRRALDEDDSVTVAGLIEGAASAPGRKGRIL